MPAVLMDPNEAPVQDAWPVIHEYPDPDAAASVTYPWVGEGYDFARPNLVVEQYEARYGGSRSSSTSEHSVISEFCDQSGNPMQLDRLNPGYQLSEDALS